MPALPYTDVPIPQQLIDAIARQDVRSAVLVLAYASFEHVNTPYSANDTRTALHIAAALGNIILVQLLLWVSYPKTIHLFLMSSIISALHVCVVVVVCSTVQMPD